MRQTPPNVPRVCCFSNDSGDLGFWLRRRLAISARHKRAYTRYPGYDLLAFNADANLSCRIQVKSRWATDYDKSFPLKNLDTDFVVLAALNRGYRGYDRRRVHPDDDGTAATVDLRLPRGGAHRVLLSGAGPQERIYLARPVNCFRERSRRPGVARVDRGRSAQPA